jgi:tetraacyldisaccharide 4'-kinase
MITFFRNKFFDWGIFKSKSFSIPVISVGNLSMGGTGKTPHIEYLVRLLMDRYAVATLSRGYGRKTKGFIEATPESLTSQIGDEPRQYAQKFNKIKIFVCEDRVAGIEKITENYPETNVILLDDAFQHRYVKPGFNILLTDYHQMFTNDFVVPSGTLREFRNGYKRADVIVITKSPTVLSPLDTRVLLERINPLPSQKVLFSKIVFDEMQLMKGIELQNPITKTYSILLFAGIANPYPLEEQLKRNCEELETLYFKDHHQYSEKDMILISDTFKNIPSRNKIIVTTQKDAMRIEGTDLITSIKNLPIFYVPIKIDFFGEDKLIFNSIIEEYVRKNI